MTWWGKLSLFRRKGDPRARQRQLVEAASTFIAREAERLDVDVELFFVGCCADGYVQTRTGLQFQELVDQDERESLALTLTNAVSDFCLRAETNARGNA